MASIEVALGTAPDLPAAAPASAVGEAPWLIEARRHMGLKEVAGPQHNGTILGWVKSLGGWFKDDETPWCGTFAAVCMKTAGQDVPEHWFRALEWAKWGKPCDPVVGAVVVFGRQGGGHVGFLVGESAANYYVLGGNQSNAVNITPIAKIRAVATRWPAPLKVTGFRLPAMSGGTVSRNEA
ncbi:TIGR02594 family protein [Altererythrobacter buctensis]|uniref:TIGR02594 family protein n=2 Tax=Alteraurantiacibacter buctensis TaxID=1503981 RepID=A0A844Z3R0_9SPHN|nr:TIGR02594 family protein [Alteraurantiacibacter buctensis]